MRAVAKFVMRGRPQAIGVALIAASFPPLHWLCSAVVSLVVLRKGMVEGLLILLWASLPMLVITVMYQNPWSLLALLVVVSTAYVLRTSASWEMTLVASVVAAALASLVFEAVSNDVFVSWIEVIQKLQVELIASDGMALDAHALHNMLFGMLAGACAFTSLLFLILARWWQSALYNQGGFGLEFRALRLSPWVAMAMALMIAGLSATDSFSRWYLLLMVPMLMASIGLIHWFVAEKKLAGSWLVSFYLLLILMSQLIMPCLAMLAVVDSWLDLRNRIQPDRKE